VGSVKTRVAGTGFNLYFTVGTRIAIVAIAYVTRVQGKPCRVNLALAVLATWT
jgi:hypothetical protein